MNHEIGGWLWLIMDVVMVAILGAAFIYGSLRWRDWKRRSHVDIKAREERDRATRQLYGRR